MRLRLWRRISFLSDTILWHGITNVTIAFTREQNGKTRYKPLIENLYFPSGDPPLFWNLQAVGGLVSYRDPGKGPTKPERSWMSRQTKISLGRVTETETIKKKSCHLYWRHHPTSSDIIGRHRKFDDAVRRCQTRSFDAIWRPMASDDVWWCLETSLGKPELGCLVDHFLYWLIYIKKEF